MPEDNAHVDLDLNPEPAEHGLERFNTALKPLKELGKELKEPIEVVKRLAFVFAEIAGVAGLVVAGVTAVIAIIKAAREEAGATSREFNTLKQSIESVGSLKVSATGFEDLDKEVAKLDEAFNKLNSGRLNLDTSAEGKRRFDELSKEIQDKTEEIEARAAARRKAREDQERDDKFNAAARDAKSLADETLSEEDRIEKARVEGIERAALLRKNAQDDAERQIADDLDRETREKAERDENAFRERAAKEQQAIEDAAREREKREEEANERIAKQFGEALQRVLEQATTSLNAAIDQQNSRLTITVENIGRVVQQIYQNQPTGGGRR